MRMDIKCGMGNMGNIKALIFTLIAICFATGFCDKTRDETEARDFVDKFNTYATELITASALASWQAETNITSYNQELSVAAYLRLSEYMRESAKNASEFDWQNFQDEETKRLFMMMAYVGTSVLESEEIERAENLEAEMKGIYSSAKVCDRPRDTNATCYQLEPGLTEIMSTSRDWEDLAWAWRRWRDVSGGQYPEKYTEYTSLANKAARIEGFKDAGEYWQSFYETENFEDVVASIWDQVKPLYQQLHAYTRRKLMRHYSDHDFPSSGHIPAHLLGNMWSQSWESLIDLLVPFPDTPFLDVTSSLQEQGYTPLQMFQVAEEFFTSIGLDAFPEAFWEHSMIEKPADGRNVVCHASAWNFQNKKDYRIKMCTVVTMENFYTIHHEMGHVQYYLEYKNLPVKFRNGANPGFHEAVGDVIALSVTTPEHLHKIGLLDEVVNNTEFDLNFLMTQALGKIAFLPFGYLVDQWRWQVFKGDVTEENYNRAWWKLRCETQGVSPPVPRSDKDFDAGAKFHVPANVPYIRYFVAHVLQFQFHKALCEASGYNGPLHRCDIYNSLEAGTKLSEMLQMGASQPWQDAMEAITGQRNMDAGPLVEYFQPILDWLREENAGYDVTWDENNCPDNSFVDDDSSTANMLHVSTWLSILLVSFYVCLM